MTTGQKIASKRKELGLSQEALGAELGVSRQTIYKWESDASLPEIDKLIALSRRFQVPVGWLLGVEEETARPELEFSPEQLKLLEEILGRYQQTEQKELSAGQQEQVERLMQERLGRQERPKRRRWPWVLAALVLIWTGGSLLNRLEQMDQQYNNLTGSIQQVTTSVDRQINTITNRVEEILKAQNSLTADYSTEYVSADLAENTAEFFLRAVPKTYTPGMSVIFLADNGQEVLEFPAEEGENGAFTAQAVIPLTDSIALSAVFVTGETRQTQLLDQYQGLYRGSFPEVTLNDYAISNLMDLQRNEEGVFALTQPGYVTVMNSEELMADETVRSIQVGLFHNRNLVCWLTPCEKPDSFRGFEEEAFYRLDPMNLELLEGDELAFAALCTDQYGRQWVCPSVPEYTVQDGVLTWPEESVVYQDQTPADWGF